MGLSNGDKINAVARLAGTKEEMMVVHTESKGSDDILPAADNGESEQ